MHFCFKIHTLMNIQIKKSIVFNPIKLLTSRMHRIEKLKIIEEQQRQFFLAAVDTQQKERQAKASLLHLVFSLCSSSDQKHNLLSVSLFGRTNAISKVERTIYDHKSIFLLDA